ncbi:hypothetical protein M413DRAFT_362806 [Hebeloma cylindrosporum]|uniref:Restriction of telomere capping protein 4 n=1 Tax=Hebeloma cylindrosporum TaxID=76867 RepID=A0A0C3C7E4_HEBCY|nr:hypothetical protein M413DRAFT_362806 [Hebeloma cylindrosporum h7]
MDKFLATHGSIDNASRISRPLGMGLAYENLGISLDPPGATKSKKPTPSASQGNYSKFRPAPSTKSSSSQPTPSSSQGPSRSMSDNASRRTIGKNSRNPPKGTIVLGDSESSDEIDFLSSQAEGEEDDLHDRKKKKRELQAKKGKNVPEAAFVDEQGKQHAYDPKFPPKKKFAGLKFTKTKKTEQASDNSMVPISRDSEKEQYLEQKSTRTSHLNKDMAKSTATTSKSAEGDDDVVYVSPLSGKSANSNRRTSPIPSRVHRRLPSNTTQPPSAQPRPVPRPKNGGRPVPFPLNSEHKSTYEPRSSQTNAPSSSAAPLNMMPIDTSSQTTVALERYRTWSESPERSEKKAELDDFPHLSPPSSPARKRITVGDFPFVSPLGGTKTRAEPMKSHASSSRLPVPFPMPSPQSKTDDRPKGKPYIQPSQAKDKGKGKNKVQIGPCSEEEDAGGLKASEKRKREKKAKKLEKKADPFPMSTQVLASIRSPSVPPTWSSSPAGPSRSGKRTSEGGSDDERISKRSRTERDALLQSPARLLFDEEGDSISISPNVDPKSLCPYCDTPLPSSPSPLLQNILAATRKKSQRDPRPSNPLGLKAPLAAFNTVCQRHRFESQILPEAEKKGWPKTIEWKKLGERIAKMKEMLQALIEDTGQLEGEDNDDWEVVVQSNKNAKISKKGAKARSLFWVEIMAEIKSKGLRAVSGVRGQFANFEKAQPGYYGELGSVIIHQTLYNMFPPASMDPNSIAPLTANEFVQRILVPEVALHLIMEDKGFSDEDMQEALTILRESSAYGVAMFPEDGGEWDGNKKQEENGKIGVGDRIVMERAKKRRKELEEEEREEKERKAVKEQQSRPRPRPKPVAKGSSNISVLAPVKSGDERSIRSNNRVRSDYSDMDTDTTSEADSAIQGSDSDNIHQRTSVRRDRSLSASETRRQTPIPRTRTTSRILAGLSLDSDSDQSSKAGGKRPPRSSLASKRKQRGIQRVRSQRYLVANPIALLRSFPPAILPRHLSRKAVLVLASSWMTNPPRNPGLHEGGRQAHHNPPFCVPGTVQR